MIEMPCEDCGKKRSELATPQGLKKPCPQATPLALINVARATAFSEAMLPLVHEAGLQIASGNSDRVTVLLVLRRRIGFLAAHFESCNICRQDIEMSMDFDQYMINAKTARLTFTERQKRRQALGMYLNFQKSIIRGAWVWAVNPLLKDFVSRLVGVHRGKVEE